MAIRGWHPKETWERDLHTQNRPAKETDAQDVCPCEEDLHIHAYIYLCREPWLCVRDTQKRPGKETYIPNSAKVTCKRDLQKRRTYLRTIYIYVYIYTYICICIYIYTASNGCKYVAHQIHHGKRDQTRGTACCIWSVISSISNLNRSSSSLGLFCHVLLKRDQWDRDWRLRLTDTPNAIGCIYTHVL